MGEGNPGQAKADHPASTAHSPQGGVKDTDDLSSIEDVQKTGMQEKAKQVENLPESVIGADTPKTPNRRP